MKEGRKLEYPEKIPYDEIQKIHNRDSNPHSTIAAG